MILETLLVYTALAVVATAVFAVHAYCAHSDTPPTCGQAFATGLLWPLVLFALAFARAERAFNTPLWGGKKEKRDD